MRVDGSLCLLLSIIPHQAWRWNGVIEGFRSEGTEQIVVDGPGNGEEKGIRFEFEFRLMLYEIEQLKRESFKRRSTCI